MYGFINVHCNTKFFVLNDYEVNEKKTSLKPTEDAVKKFHEKSKYKYTYNPLEDSPELYLEVAKLEENDTNKLIRFARNYGLPYESKKVQYIDYNKLVFLNLDLEDFYLELDLYKRIIWIWDSINSKNEVKLEEVKSRFSHAASLFQIRSQIGVADNYLNSIDDEQVDATLKMNERNHSLWEDWKKVKNEDLETIAKTFIIFLLNSNRAGRNQFDLIDGQIKPAIHFSNLFEVAYYQLSQAMVNDIQLSHCDNCYSLFEPRHGNQRFCSPNQPNMYKGKSKKRSSCENAYNQRLKRQRRKLKK